MSLKGPLNPLIPEKVLRGHLIFGDQRDWSDVAAHFALLLLFPGCACLTMVFTFLRNHGTTVFIC